MDKRIAVISIIIDNRKKAAPKVNEILNQHGEIILGRVGIPYRDKGLSVIALIVDGTTDELGALTGKLGMIEQVEVKLALSKI